jgi:hypothetical protein
LKYALEYHWQIPLKMNFAAFGSSILITIFNRRCQSTQAQRFGYFNAESGCKNSSVDKLKYWSLQADSRVENEFLPPFEATAIPINVNPDVPIDSQ